MNIILRNSLAVIAGLAAGSIVNMAIVMFGGVLVPAPVGVDTTNMESIAASIHLFEARHFVFPFLAHAIGTLVGGFVASVIGGSKQMVLAMIVGGLFLVLGIVASLMIPAPFWFEAVDVLFAYVPMALLGWKLSGKG